MGHAFFTAPNPPFGAVFTYYLKENIQKRKEARRKSEKELEEEGKDTPYPGWDELRREGEEKDPYVVLTVLDTAGHVVRRIAAPATAGFHRVAWDLRYPSARPWEPKDRVKEPWEQKQSNGFLAAPGSYVVRMGRMVDGEYTDLGLEQTFQVVPLRSGTLEGATPGEYASFMQELASLQGAILGAKEAIDASVNQLRAIQETLLRSTGEEEHLDEAARNMERWFLDLRERLLGNSVRQRMGDPGPIPVSRRLQVVVSGTAQSTHGPTASHRVSLEIVREEFDSIRSELEPLIDLELPALELRLDAAGVPWTPGRGVPPLN